MTDVNSIMSYKMPPIYVEGRSYEEFSRDLDVWLLLKVATAEEQGPLLFRTLSPRAKAACKTITLDQIGSKDGFKLIRDKLDKLYLKDANQRIFVTLDRFEKFKRPAGMTMDEFLVEFENLHTEVKSKQCTYPDGVLAYRLIKAANLSDDKEQLCRATVETGKWSYESVLNQLKKIFSDTLTLSTSNPAIKVENALHTTCTSCKQYEQDNFDYYDYQSGEEEYIDNQQGCDHNKDGDFDVLYTPDYRNNGQVKFRPPSQRNNTQNFRRSFSQNPRGNFNNNRQFMNRFNADRPPTNSEYKSLRDMYVSDPSVPNPKDSKGNFTVCRRCRSTYHWLIDCPHNDTEKQKSSNTFYTKSIEDEVYIALLQSSIPTQENQILDLVKETLSHGVIDSGCSKTVAGENWLNDYIDSLPQEDVSNIKYKESSAFFKFGDSQPIASIEKVYLPVVIGGKNVLLETEIVKADIPLLLSRDTMIKASAKMDFSNASVTLFGEQQKLICTSSGHYAIPISKSNDISKISTEKPNNILFTIDENKDVRSMAKKLHHQFGHPPLKRLVKFVKTAGVTDEKLLTELEQIDVKCNTCKRYKKASPRPVVSFPLAHEFNETIAVDLKTYENNKIYFIHIIDHATRFSAAAVIRSKSAKVIIEQIFKIWISIFGPPQKLLSDNGGEFANHEFAEFCENFNINFLTTAAESPWSNGVCERHNGIISEVVNKILEDINCTIDVALCWAINAKNSLQNIYGFSPYQLVFGKNPILPSVLTNKLPALEGVTSSMLVAKQLNALHKAREEYIKCEASEKIRRALRAKTRTHNDLKYLAGDNVFYKREGDNKWRGPGRVLGQDGSKILIKIPNSYAPISVHSCRVTLANKSEEYENEKKDADIVQSDNSTANKTLNYHIYEDDDLLNNDPVIRNETEIETKTDENNDQLNIPLANINNSNYEHPINREIIPEENVSEEILTPETTEEVIDTVTDDQNHSSNSDKQIINQEITLPDNKNKMPKMNQCIKVKIDEDDHWEYLKIVGRAGKMSGKNKNWINVKNLKDEKEEFSLNWEKVSEWHPLEYNNLLFTIENDPFEAARQAELENWRAMQVYEEVLDNNQPAVSVKWIYKEKLDENNKSKKKARLVARGYEYLDQNKKFMNDSPTCNKDSLRIVIAIVSSMNWELNSLDVKAAYLQGKILDRDIYLRPPPEAHADGKLWKLRHCVYGLNDSGRYWYMRLREELIKMGCRCTKADPSVFYYFTNTLEGLLIAHVDDCAWGGNENFKSLIIENMKNIFKMSSENTSPFKYIGIEVYHDEKGIYLSQKEYVEELQEIEINPLRKQFKDQIVTENEKEKLRIKIGQLNWLATQTRPDLSYAVSELSSAVHNASVKHLLKANKVIKHCKSNNIALSFPKLNLQDLTVRCYSDASFGKLIDGGSQGGMFIELMSNNQSCPIWWASKKIKRVVNNVMSAETLALKEAIDTGYNIQSLLNEILYNNQPKVSLEAITDSRSLFEASFSKKSVEDKRLRIDLAVIREYIINNECKLRWVRSEKQLADILTKDGVDASTILSHISA